MYLSNTTLFDGGDMYRIYYIKIHVSALDNGHLQAVYSPRKSSIAA